MLTPKIALTGATSVTLWNGQDVNVDPATGLLDADAASLVQRLCLLGAVVIDVDAEAVAAGSKSPLAVSLLHNVTAWVRIQGLVDITVVVAWLDAGAHKVLIQVPETRLHLRQHRTVHALTRCPLSG